MQQDGSFKCVCESGYTGRLCEKRDYCIGHKCVKGATCVSQRRMYFCVCPHGYTGRFCADQISSKLNNCFDIFLKFFFTVKNLPILYQFKKTKARRQHRHLAFSVSSVPIPIENVISETLSPELISWTLSSTTSGNVRY
ncbi:hEGF domain containing protein [Trichuris trichiura]|uniref:HEGF domain containing protein n=1 Tax=Trichuris trichiura TaxID=36087 RepID=A0A077ZG31_TRITR|nr:hEGF domain containing protein [Trichuris trichiura]